jgi:hypothetical protein
MPLAAHSERRASSENRRTGRAMFPVSYARFAVLAAYQGRVRNPGQERLAFAGAMSCGLNLK